MQNVWKMFSQHRHKHFLKMFSGPKSLPYILTSNKHFPKTFLWCFGQCYKNINKTFFCSLGAHPLANYYTSEPTARWVVLAWWFQIGVLFIIKMSSEFSRTELSAIVKIRGVFTTWLSEKVLKMVYFYTSCPKNVKRGVFLNLDVRIEDCILFEMSWFLVILLLFSMKWTQISNVSLKC